MSTDVDVWAAFIRKRLDKDEKRATRAHDGEVEFIGDDAAEHGCEASGRYIRHNLPSRAYIRVLALRRLVDLIATGPAFVGLPRLQARMLSEIASAWADHPDYPGRPQPVEPVKATHTVGTGYVMPAWADGGPIHGA